MCRVAKNMAFQKCSKNFKQLENSKKFEWKFYPTPFMFWSISTFKIPVFNFSSLRPMFWPIFNQGPPLAFRSIFLTEFFFFSFISSQFLSPLYLSLFSLNRPGPWRSREREREMERGEGRVEREGIERGERRASNEETREI